MFLVSQLLTSAILGADFSINTCAIIDFPERCALLKVDKTTKQLFEVRVDAERDGTNAETSIGLSAKRTSPFKSAGASVQWTASSRAVRFCGQRLYYL